jgi:hypothetical protein
MTIKKITCHAGGKTFAGALAYDEQVSARRSAELSFA